MDNHQPGEFPWHFQKNAVRAALAERPDYSIRWAVGGACGEAKTQVN